MDKKELQILFNQGKHEKIYEFFRNNLPESPDEYNLKALSCFYMGYTNEAISTLKNGLIAFPKNKDLLFNLVEILYNNKEFEEALKYALKAIEVEQENYVYYDIIANIYFLKDDLQNAYLYAEKAKNYAPPHVVEQLVFNYSQFERNQLFDNRIAKTTNKMVLVGSACNYPDSFKKFIENNWEVYVIKTKTWRAFEINYKLLKSIGAKIVETHEIEDFLKDKGSQIDFLIRTGYFYGGNDLHRSHRLCDIEQIDTFFKMTNKIKKENKDAIAMLAFDGDSFFSEEIWNDWLRKRIEICDYILFDTENLKDYFLNKVSKDFDQKKLKVLRVEMPCTRDIKINFHDNYKKRILTMGRVINSYTPISNLFIDELKEQISIGRGSNYEEIEAGRKKFLRDYGNYAFGLGYFYDFYQRNESFQEILVKEKDDMIKSNALFYVHPSVYGLTNVPRKIITYLQFGIIPVIPDDENDFHRELIENQMTIGLDRNVLFFDPYSYSDELITNIRKNIMLNSHIFSFDNFYHFVNSLIKEREIL